LYSRIDWGGKFGVFRPGSTLVVAVFATLSYVAAMADGALSGRVLAKEWCSPCGHASARGASKLDVPNLIEWTVHSADAQVLSRSSFLATYTEMRRNVCFLGMDLIHDQVSYTTSLKRLPFGSIGSERLRDSCSA
jgi:hypothetical protein